MGGCSSKQKQNWTLTQGVTIRVHLALCCEYPGSDARFRGGVHDWCFQAYKLAALCALHSSHGLLRWGNLCFRCTYSPLLGAPNRTLRPLKAPLCAGFYLFYIHFELY